MKHLQACLVPVPIEPPADWDRLKDALTMQEQPRPIPPEPPWTASTPCDQIASGRHNTIIQSKEGSRVDFHGASTDG